MIYLELSYAIAAVLLFGLPLLGFLVGTFVL
jgi:hypothetical protein